MQDISADTIEQAGKGNMRAFEEIYKKTSGFVYNVAFRMAGNSQDAQEITQDVFVTLYRKLNSYRFESALKTWIYRITYNLSINHIKKYSYKNKRNVPFNDALENIPAVQEEINDEGNIEKILETLNQDQKACLILRGIEGLSYQEISETLKININTVRSRLKRAREILLNRNKENRLINQEA